MLNWFFNKIAGLRPEAYYFIKKRFQQRRFRVNYARFFRTPILYVIIYVIQNRSSIKNHAKITAKFMWTAVSGISENRPCLAGCKFLIFCRIDYKSVFKVLRLSTDMQFSTDQHPINVLKLLTRHKW